MRGLTCPMGWGVPISVQLGDWHVQENVRAPWPSRPSEGRVGSSESKRKRGSQREVKLEVIHMVLECTNDQLRTIAEWPACVVANDNHVRQEFICILREMPKLTSFWIGHCCKGTSCLVWTTCGISYKSLIMKRRGFAESSYATSLDSFEGMKALYNERIKRDHNSI